MSLKIETHVVEGVSVVSCHGRIVFGEESGILRQTLKDLLAQTKQIVLDLSDVSYIDSGGLGTMVGAYSSARALGADIKLTGLGPRLQEVLHITKLVTVFEIYDSQLAAIESFVHRQA